MKFLLFILFSFSTLAVDFGSHGRILRNNEALFATEVAGVFNNGKGVGVQTRFRKGILPGIDFDGGIGVNNGDRASKIFVNMDFELYPDYDSQPRLVLRGFFERWRIDDFKNNHFGMAPIVSKAFRMDSLEFYPYIGVPLGINMNQTTDEAEFTMQTAIGVTADLGALDAKGLNASVELDIDMVNSYTGGLVGLSFVF